ncbi:hypothetical protein HAALTHF_23670n [Vreelandella aquamarina]|nr:hypothetical protein HAALTHF_23670n [Halomonas axialensis]
MRVKVTDTSGALIHNAVAKIGSMAEIQDEARRFDIHVSRLRPEATPRKLATIEFGGGALAGVFYGLADGYDKSVLDVLQDAPQFSDKVVEAIRILLANGAREYLVLGGIYQKYAEDFCQTGLMRN